MCRREDYEHLGDSADWAHWWGEKDESMYQRDRRAYLHIAKWGFDASGVRAELAEQFARTFGLAWPPPTYELALANIEAIETVSKD